MKNSYFLLCLFLATLCFAQSKTDSTQTKEKNIQEVLIPSKQYKYKHWGVDSKLKNISFATYPDRRTDEKSWKKEQANEMAIRFSNRKKVKIEKININISDFVSDRPVTLQVNVYNEKDGMPGESILNKDITAVLTKESITDGSFSLDVQNEDITIDETFFVSVQFTDYFKGRISISGAFLSKCYTKENNKWEKLAVAAPAINIDVRVEK